MAYEATAPVMASKDKAKGKPEQYEIDCWTRTIVEAMEILQDPKKMEYVKGAMDKKKEAITSFDDLREKLEAEEV